MLELDKIHCGDNCTLIDLKRAVERITGVPI